MTFEEVLDRALAMLQRRGRLTYCALKLQFGLDDSRCLAWTGASHQTPPPVSPPAPAQERAPLSYTPPI
jgi:hypothetical protein